MENISPQHAYLYRILKNGLILSVIGSLFPLFFLSVFSKNQFSFNNQQVRNCFSKSAFEKRFPLITVMGPSGPLMHCYGSYA